MYMYELLLFVITGRPNLVKPGAGASIGRGGKISHFLDLRVNISKMVGDTGSSINDVTLRGGGGFTLV